MKKALLVVALVLLLIGGSMMTLSLMKPDLTGDSYVDQMFPNTNYGSLDHMGVANAYVDPLGTINMRSFVKFDIDLPSNVTVYDAQLMATSYGFIDPKPSNLHVHKVLGEWDEISITWNNQPPISQIKGTDSVDGITAPEIFNVTTIVQGWVQGGEINYGFAFTTDPGSVVTLGTKESPCNWCGSKLEIRYIYMGEDKKVIIDDDDVDTTDTDTGQNTDDDSATDEEDLNLYILVGIIVLGFIILIFSIRRS